ncbi:MAG: SWIM zinc finger family protein [Myxococcota bacterium]
MTTVATEYSGHSGLQTSGSSNELGLSTNERRPVRFHARVDQHVHSLKRSLQTLGELVWSEYQWMDEEAYEQFMLMVLDPVITVHPDRVFFEAFSQDMSSYGLVIADRDIFQADGEVQCGTTNIDFTKGLWRSLEQMRSRRETNFGVGPTGFGVSTDDGPQHFEDKVELPQSWVRGFLQLQGAMAMPGTRVSARPVDIASIIRTLRNNTAHQSPRSMRFEFEPGQDTEVVLEPWEKSITLRGARHNYAQHKTTRIWGRYRLELIENLLPYANKVDIYLKGRALPAFYAVELPGVTFVLGLSGWTGNNWTQEASFDMLTSSRVDKGVVERALIWLREHFYGSVDDIASELGEPVDDTARALSQLCRYGMAIYDVQTREYRHRELFEERIDPAEYFPPNPRKEKSVELVEGGAVELTKDEMRETEKKDKFGGVKVFEDRVIEGAVDGEETHVVLQSTGRIIFGRCSCAFFDENLMNMGPCEHMLALRRYVDTEID